MKYFGQDLATQLSDKLTLTLQIKTNNAIHYCIFKIKYQISAFSEQKAVLLGNCTGYSKLVHSSLKLQPNCSTMQ